jgi:hypothetical protein
LTLWQPDKNRFSVPKLQSDLDGEDIPGLSTATRVAKVFNYGAKVFNNPFLGIFCNTMPNSETT